MILVDRAPHITVLLVAVACGGPPDPTPLIENARTAGNALLTGGARGALELANLGSLATAGDEDGRDLAAVVSVPQTPVTDEWSGMAAALERSGLRVERPEEVAVIPTGAFLAVNAQLRAVAGADAPILDTVRHAYALALPLAAYPVRWRGETRVPALLFAVPHEGDADGEDREIELLRVLLALLVTLPIQDQSEPSPQPEPECPPIPDTDATVQSARDRLAPGEIHKNHPNPNAKQGQWMHDPQNNRVARGQTLTFYKIRLGVGCERPGSWGIGLEVFDLQFRIVLGRNAATRPAADGGQTPGGLEGTLGHEAEHGETLGDAFATALAGQPWNGVPWDIKTILDDMQFRRYGTRAAAERAAAAYQERLEKAVARLAQAAANLHTSATGGPNAGTAPRDGTPEPLDNPDQQKVADEKARQDWIDEVKELINTHGYKSVVNPGQFGDYP